MRDDTIVPKGFSLREDRGVRAWIARGYEPAFVPLAAALRGEPLAGAEVISPRGRGAVLAAPVPGRDGERMIVRRYRHGGALRFLGETMVGGAGRPKAEVAALAAAREAGVSVARPIAGLAAGSRLFARCLLATADESGAVDLLSWLRSSPPRRERRAIARLLATEIRKLHDAGIWHADLHVKNVLVVPRPELGVVLIDFDRARLLGRPLDARRRFRNLFRLDRSLEKTGLSPRLVSRGDRIACLRAYLDVAGRLARAPGLKARLFWGRVGLAFHRFSWRLGGTPA